MPNVHSSSLDFVEAGAPANPIEITSEMIEAEIYSLTGAPCFIEVAGGESLDEIVRTVFLAMEAVRLKRDCRDHGNA
jgi:hypothetical protein